MIILIHTVHRGREYLYSAMLAGVGGYLLKEDAKQDLISALQKIRNGKDSISPILEKKLEGENLPGHFVHYILGC